MAEEKTMKQYADKAISYLVSIYTILSLLAVAVIGAILGGFLNWRFAAASVALSIAAIGLTLVNVGGQFEASGTYLLGIWKAVSGLYQSDQEAKRPPAKPTPTPEPVQGKPN
jgi:nitrate reductase NapE component